MAVRNLSENARLVLLELDAPPWTPISAKELGLIVSMSAAEVGAWLRELRSAGLAVPLDPKTLEPLDRVPAGKRVVWAPISAPPGPAPADERQPQPTPAR